MNKKELKFSKDARKRLLSGAEKLTKAVASSLGSKGRNTLIANDRGIPVVTNDGVSIARAIALKDPYENLAVEMIKEVANSQNEESGDGTSTATVLAYAMAKEGMKALSKGFNPMSIKRGIEKAVEVVVSELKSISKDISSSEEVIQVASISANNDRQLGEHIAEAIERVGKEGIVTVEESKTCETHVEYVEGMSIDRGYMSPYFATDRDHMTTSFDDPYVLIVDRAINNMQEILPILEKVAGASKSLLIIAEDLQGDTLNTLALNVMKGVLKVCGIKSPGFGDKRKAMLEDIAILTGGKVVSQELGLNLELVKLEDLGRCKKITVSKDETVLINGAGADDDILSRVAQIKLQIEESTNDYDIERLQERLAKLSGGVAIINVGATTEVELKERKDRVEDALSATRSAIDEGIIAGGGTVLAQIATNLLSSDIYKSLSKEEKLGFKIVKKAIEEPIRQIAKNAGANGTKVLKRVQSSKQGTGFNANTLTYVDMLESGVVDPSKVTRTALQSASSIASLLLTTEVAIIDLPLTERELNHR